LEEIIGLLDGCGHYLIMANRTRLVNTGDLVLLAAIIVFGLVLPTPNNTSGGTVKMILIIFLAVSVRGLVKHFRSRNKGDRTDNNG